MANGKGGELVRTAPRTGLRWGLMAAIASLLVLSGGLPASAEDDQPAAAAPAAAGEAEAPAADGEQAKPAAAAKIRILLVREIREDRLPPLSLLDLPPPDDGVAGAKLAISDNNTTGRFLGQDFTLDVASSAKSEDLVTEAQKYVAEGVAFIVADVEPKTLLALADALKDKEAQIFNASAPDDNLREEDCRANVKHTAPTRTMLTDALAQYLTFKRWQNWILIIGPTDKDKLYAEAVRRSAKRFGHKILEERNFAYDPGSRRSDGGYEQIQQQIPSFTQRLPAHDVEVVADEGQLFGDYFPYRTWDARPVVGTSGLYATTWHPAIELWGGTQFQNRFKKQTNRIMRNMDYDAWLAIRVIGEAATRTKSNKFADLNKYIHTPEFEVAAFKGVKTTFRNWNGQLRQPLLSAARDELLERSGDCGLLGAFAAQFERALDQFRCAVGMIDDRTPFGDGLVQTDLIHVLQQVM